MKFRKVIAVDFDGTIVENEFPKIGAIKKHVVKRMKEEKAKGNILILWTCRGGSHLDKALQFMLENDIPYDFVNKNPLNNFGDNSRKLFAHEYWDDRAINVEDL